MATVNKDFKLKNGLIVEGTNATVNGNQILTENASDEYIIDLIGGETLVTSVNSDQLEVVDGELSVKSGVFDADGAAAAAETAANSYTDTALEDYTPTASLDATVGGYGYLKDADLPTMYSDSDVDAHLVGGDGIDYSAGTISIQIGADAGLTTSDGTLKIKRSTVDGWYDASGAASTAQSNAEDYTDTALESYTLTEDLDATVGGYGYLKSADLGSYATETYVNDAVDALVDGAPGLLDTLNEIAAAINDDANYATTMTTALAGKQNNLTAGTGIDIVSDTISVTANTYDAYGAASTAESNANSYTDGEITTALTTAQGYADTAESDANSYTDGEITTALTTAQGYANTAEQNAKDYADTLAGGLDTDDIEEGSVNLYFTDGRAKTSAAELLTNASLTNITITGDGSGLTITAENGVADSTTDDLAEGETNLYFTDQRVIDAVDNAVINPQAVEINVIARQVASTLEAATAGIQIGHTFAKADYRSAEFLVKVAYGDHTEISKVLLTLDINDNIAITEYGIVGTNGSASSVSADISGTNVRLLVTTANNNSTVTVMGTLLV